jgi:hypothetical protein
MELENSTLDDISAVIGFTPTCRLAAWFGDGSSVYIPLTVQDGQVLPRLIGLSAAKRLSEEWGGEILSLPRLRGYEDDQKRRLIARMVEGGFSTREVATYVRMGERRVQQIVRDLEASGLLAPVAPRSKRVGQGPDAEGERPVEKPAWKDGGKNPGEKRGENDGENDGEKTAHEISVEISQCEISQENCRGKCGGQPRRECRVGGRKEAAEWFTPLATTTRR